jgi:hypothetical protein
MAMFCAIAVTALAADETKTEQVQERASSSDDLQTAAAGEGRSKFLLQTIWPTPVLSAGRQMQPFVLDLI